MGEGRPAESRHHIRVKGSAHGRLRGGVDGLVVPS